MNQNPEQLARDHIDSQLLACGWVIQGKRHINLAAGLGVAVREYQTDVGPADYTGKADGESSPMRKLSTGIRLLWISRG